jgi:hypothetical protein
MSVSYCEKDYLLLDEPPRDELPPPLLRDDEPPKLLLLRDEPPKLLLRDELLKLLLRDDEVVRLLLNTVERLLVRVDDCRVSLLRLPVVVRLLVLNRSLLYALPVVLLVPLLRVAVLLLRVAVPLFACCLVVEAGRA